MGVVSGILSYSVYTVYTPPSQSCCQPTSDQCHPPSSLHKRTTWSLRLPRPQSDLQSAYGTTLVSTCQYMSIYVNMHTKTYKYIQIIPIDTNRYQKIPSSCTPKLSLGSVFVDVHFFVCCFCNNKKHAQRLGSPTK